MTNTVVLQSPQQSPKQSPKLLFPGEGKSFQMLSHIFTTKISAADTNGEWIMYEVTDTAGNGAPLHSHPWDETFYIVEGEMEVQVGNCKALAVAGTSLFVPANVAHNFKICSPTIRVLVTIAPAAAEAFYREVGEKVTSLPPDPEVFGAICEKHNVRLF
jgi:quercetin dioxygenase-like cupin family protein